MDLHTDRAYSIPVYPDQPDLVRMMVTDSKLGGYIVGGDSNTYCPELWRWLVTNLGVKSVIDIGCGEGHPGDVFAQAGALYAGVEGVPQPMSSKLILCHDYRKGPLGSSGLRSLGLTEVRFDLAWSCEFVEHVEERYVANFMETFCCADLCLITHADPGQPGWNHVNCRTGDYWRGAFAAHGYAEDELLTQRTRALCPEPGNHYARSGLVFRRVV